MSSETFLQPRLTGGRFQDHGIPLEFLKDLAVLEEMIVEVAKAEFLKANPERQRCPRGFTEDIELKLTEITEGSAVPLIELVHTGSTFFPRYHECFKRARETIANAIGAAEQNQSITEYLPERTLGYFDRMGRSLREGEAIEFVSPTRATPARLTKETRRKLVLASSTVKEFTEESTVRGLIPEADQERMSFTIQLFNGRRVTAPLTAQHFDTIIEAFQSYLDGTRVWLQGIARVNRNDRLLGFDSIEHVSILDPLDVPARLEELRTLQDGWLEGDGRAPSKEGLDWLSRAFSQHYPDELPLPYLYPTEEGGIQAEWTLKPNEVTLEIDLGRRTGEWHALNLETDEDQSEMLNLDELQDWKWIVDEVRRISGGAQ